MVGAIPLHQAYPARTQGTHFVFVKGIKRFNQLELHVFWQTTYVMVRFDGLSCIRTRFDNVCVKGSLRKEVHIFQLASFVIENVNKLVTDDFTFLFWVRNTSQLVKETFCSICFDNVQTKLATQHLHNLIGFSFTEETVVNEDTDELVADGFLKENPNDRRVNPT